MLMATISTTSEEGGTTGAVYWAESSPVGVIVPNMSFPPAIPLTLHVTPGAGFPEPEIPAVNVCVDPGAICTVEGASVIATLLRMVTEALAWAPAAVAVMVRPGLSGKIRGAV